MAKGLLGFLFGRDPQIFDKDGTVRHNLPKEKWEAWQKRYFSQPEYNWSQHTGMKAKNLRSSKHNSKN